MLDFTTKILTLLKVDNSDAKAKLRELSGEEKKLQQQQIDSNSARNKSYDDWMGTLGKANQALELVGKAVEFASDAFNAYASDLELRSAAGSVSIEGLRKASLGLRTEQELLSFAAKVNNGVFKVTEDQMQVAQRAMIALTRAGHDQAEVTKKVTDALIKGKAEGLDDFGLSVKEGATDVEKFNNLMEALAGKAAGVSEASMTTGEKMRTMGVSVQDSFDSIKKSIGELVNAMGPLIVAIADAVAIVAKILNLPFKAAGALSGVFTKDNPSKLDGYGKSWQQSMDDYAARVAAGEQLSQKDMDFINSPSSPEQRQRFDETLARLQQGKVYTRNKPGGMEYYDFSGGSPLSYDTFDPFATDSSSSLAPDSETKLRVFAEKRLKEIDDYEKGVKRAKDAQAEAARTAAAWRKEVAQIADAWARKVTDELVKQLEDEIKAAEEAARREAERIKRAAPDFDRAKADVTRAGDGVQEMQRELERQQKEKNQGYLAKIFGTPEAFSAEVQIYAQGFQLLTGAVGTAMDAWITGTDGAGKAIKKFIAEAIKSVAIQMGVEALKHGAYAIGFAALGDPRAGGHAAAAAKFAAGSVIAAGAAKAMYSSGWGGSTGAGAGASAGGTTGGTRDQREGGGRGTSGGSGGGKDSRPIQIIVGEWFAEESPRSRRQKADAAVERALRERDE